MSDSESKFEILWNAYVKSFEDYEQYRKDCARFFGIFTSRLIKDLSWDSSKVAVRFSKDGNFKKYDALGSVKDLIEPSPEVRFTPQAKKGIWQVDVKLTLARGSVYPDVELEALDLIIPIVFWKDGYLFIVQPLSQAQQGERLFRYNPNDAGLQVNELDLLSEAVFSMMLSKIQPLVHWDVAEQGTTEFLL